MQHDTNDWVAPGEPVVEAALAAIRFDRDGLVPAVAQAAGGRVLMLAWMNSDAVRATLETGRVTYWSRSRRELWRKGDTSGHVQLLRSFRIDCDGDALLLEVAQVGPACHTHRPACFFTEVTRDGLIETDAPVAG